MSHRVIEDATTLLFIIHYGYTGCATHVLYVV